MVGSRFVLPRISRGDATRRVNVMNAVPGRRPTTILTALILAAAVAGCGSDSAPARTGSGSILAVGAENQYANVISQIGGRYVSVAAIQSNPSTDPHSFEASPSIARTVSSARLVVQNGLGYDTFMNRIEAASPSSARKVIDVQSLLRLPDSTANPHIWYRPQTMPAVARAVARALTSLAPTHRAYFAANVRRFDASLRPWYAALKAFRSRYPHTPVATTEPVGDDMLRAAGARNLTPFGLQVDIMNGLDPAPQGTALQKELLSRRRVKALVYNQQVADSLTVAWTAAARGAGVPVVGMTETMPTPGYDYQSWMLAEVDALRRAVADHVSTTRL